MQSLGSFDLTVIQPYLDRYTKHGPALGGRLTTDIEITLLADGGFAADGAIQVDRLRTVDKAQKEDFLKWDRCAPRASVRRPHRPNFTSRPQIRAAYARIIIAEGRDPQRREI